MNRLPVDPNIDVPTNPRCVRQNVLCFVVTVVVLVWADILLLAYANKVIQWPGNLGWLSWLSGLVRLQQIVAFAGFVVSFPVWSSTSSPHMEGISRSIGLGCLIAAIFLGYSPSPDYNREY